MTRRKRRWEDQPESVKQVYRDAAEFMFECVEHEVPADSDIGDYITRKNVGPFATAKDAILANSKAIADVCKKKGYKPLAFAYENPTMTIFCDKFNA